MKTGKKRQKAIAINQIKNDDSLKFCSSGGNKNKYDMAQSQDTLIGRHGE